MGFQMFANTLFILLFFSNSYFGIKFTHVSAQSDDKELLLELKNNLTYDTSLSTKLLRWNKSTNHCQWSGVKCDNMNRVSSLDLSGESISGGISSALFRLAHLQSLNLALNTFDSTELPPGIGQLTELRYLNLSNAGFTGQIPSDFSSLTRLVVLDLSSKSYSSFQLENPNLGRLIRNFTRLRELHLDGVNISAKGYDWGNAISSSLPNLIVLSLSNSYITGPFDPSLAKLRSLSVIRLHDNTFSSPFPEFFAAFPNLSVLTLSSCDVSGVVPKKLFQVESMQTIDLSNNRDLEGSLPEFPSNGSLQNLVLSYTKFSGNVPESIGSLRMLSNLDLRACSVSGPIPSSIKNLNQLVYFDLSLNRFSGSVPSFAFLKKLELINLHSNGLTGQIPDSLWEGLESLTFLDLSENSLKGEIPSSLFALPVLKVLDLSNNNLYGSIKDSTDSYSSSLESLRLSLNNLEGPIPQFFFELQNLSTLSLSSNKFNGSIDLTHFQKLKDLATLELSHNNISVHVSEEVPISSLFPHLNSLMLASCKLQKIPPLMNQSSLMMLDLSDNGLEGEIPNWIWEIGNGFLRFLNLSNNHFSHLQEPYNLRSLHYLDLHSNNLKGQIPTPPPLAVFVDFSSNDFSSPLPPNIGNFLSPARFFSIANSNIIGTIPPSLCNATHLQILDFSNNSLHGKIPSCLLGVNSLTVLNLRRNNLTGGIPDAFQVGSVLETLDLSYNGLQGKVPKSLTRCTELKVLNLGNNELNDTFPCWLKNLPKLRVIVLRFNKFHGNMSCLGDVNNTWPDLQIINLASNNLNGVLPENLFRNLKALMVVREDINYQLNYLNFVGQFAKGVTYHDSVRVTLKGQDVELRKILTIFTSIDFSNNRLEGTIPDTIGELKSLYVLNLSHNALSGHIPASMRDLQTLESLDLSSNNLDGEIPRRLVDLTFLSFLNVSFNRLVGSIPQGRQFHTFQENSFLGNEGLCDFPLNRTCRGGGGVGTPGTRSDDEGKSGSDNRDIFYVSVAMCGFRSGFWASFDMQEMEKVV